MAQQSNRVYVDGLTRFETRGRSVSAIQPPKTDHYMGRQPVRKDSDANRRMNLELELKRIRQEGKEKLTRAEKEIMSRSTDRFLQKGNNALGDMGLAGKGYGGLDYTVQNRGMPTTEFSYGPSQAQPSFNMPSQSEFRRSGLDLGKDRLDRYDPINRMYGAQKTKLDHHNRVGRFDDYTDASRDLARNAPRDLLRDYPRDIPREQSMASQNMDYLRRDIQMRGNEADIKSRLYPDDLGSYKNTKNLYGKTEQNMYQPKYQPKHFAAQYKQDYRRSDLVKREFGREVNKDYTRDLSKGLDRGFDKEVQRRMGNTNIDYLKGRSAMLGKEAGLALGAGKLQAGDFSKYMAKDYKKETEMSKLSGMRTNYQNPYHQEVRRDPIAGYRGSLRGDF